jgi:hypothetical protein
MVARGSGGRLKFIFELYTVDHLLYTVEIVKDNKTT